MASATQAGCVTAEQQVKITNLGNIIDLTQISPNFLIGKFVSDFTNPATLTQGLYLIRLILTLKSTKESPADTYLVSVSAPNSDSFAGYPLFLTSADLTSSSGFTRGLTFVVRITQSTDNFVLQINSPGYDKLWKITNSIINVIRLI